MVRFMGDHHHGAGCLEREYLSIDAEMEENRGQSRFGST